MGGYDMRFEARREFSRFHLVRLGVQKLLRDESPTRPYAHRDLLDDGRLQRAAQLAGDRLGGPAGQVRPLDDPGHWFLFEELEEPTGYLGVTLFIDRGAGEVEARRRPGDRCPAIEVQVL